MPTLTLQDPTLLKTQAYIAGKWQPADDGATFEVKNPATGETIATVPRMGTTETRRAIDTANAAWPVWRATTAKHRATILRKWHDLMLENADDLAKILTTEQGKPLAEAKGEILYAASFLEWFAEEGKRVNGDTIPTPAGDKRIVVTKEPIGVCAAITPWNFPAAMITRKVGPALAAGCPIIVKPAEATPLSALALAVLAERAGVPRGVFNVVTGGRECGAALAAHPGLSKISFTGSTPTGKLVGTAAVQNMTRFSLELGGKNPAVMLADIDVEQAIQGALAGGFFNQGQVCAAASRIYVHRSKYRQVADGLADIANAMTLGPGLDPAAQINPLVSALHRDRVNQHIARAQSAGLKFLAGGKPVDLPGYYVRPTVIADVPHDAAIVRDEVFGPVLAVVPFDDPLEALRLANDSQYGLAASLWSNDLKTVMNLVPRMEAGTVWVNCHVPLDPGMPFGGFKQSGIGREFGKYAIEGFTETKSVCIAH